MTMMASAAAGDGGLVEVTNGIYGLTPAQIVAELDKYVIGQQAAKKAVAVALRNRMRRACIDGDIRDEIKPKNILMIGATGVGKTEISRRLARLTTCPFIKVEATKFTEVGYVGRDVESMIRDLVERSVQMVKKRRIEEVRGEAAARAKERILDALIPPRKVQEKVSDFMQMFSGQPDLTIVHELEGKSEIPNLKYGVAASVAANEEDGED